MWEKEKTTGGRCSQQEVDTLVNNGGQSFPMITGLISLSCSFISHYFLPSFLLSVFHSFIYSFFLSFYPVFHSFIYSFFLSYCVFHSFIYSVFLSVILSFFLFFYLPSLLLPSFLPSFIFSQVLLVSLLNLLCGSSSLQSTSPPPPGTTVWFLMAPLPVLQVDSYRGQRPGAQLLQEPGRGPHRALVLHHRPGAPLRELPYPPLQRRYKPPLTLFNA